MGRSLGAVGRGARPAAVRRPRPAGLRGRRHLPERRRSGVRVHRLVGARGGAVRRPRQLRPAARRRRGARLGPQHRRPRREPDGGAERRRAAPRARAAHEAQEPQSPAYVVLRAGGAATRRDRLPLAVPLHAGRSPRLRAPRPPPRRPPPELARHFVVRAWSIVIAVVWQHAGLSMVIFLAGLQSVPPELHEAAASTAPARYAVSGTSPGPCSRRRPRWRLCSRSSAG